MILPHSTASQPASRLSRWKSWLARLVFPYGAVRSVLVGPAAGTRFHVAPGMGAMYALGGDHHQALTQIAGRIRPGGVVYDIGANQGQFTLPLAAIVGAKGHVLAVEPLPHNQQALKANLALGSFPQVTVVEAAISSTGGTRPFVFDLDRRTMGTFAGSTVKLDAESATLSVITLTMDELSRRHGCVPDCIKIDVEGAADEVLGGAEETLAASRPCLLVELHLSGRHDRERLALIEVAKKFGYSIAMLDGLPVEASRADGEYQAWCEPVRTAARREL